MAPDVAFRGQPFADEDTAGAFLSRALRDEAIERLSLAVAWARFGGLARIEPEVEAFRQRGGTIEAIFGVDEGVATRPGLLKAISMLDLVHVLHDASGRTFHPKLYLAAGPTKAVLLAGSSNLTAGGLYFNYEASLEATFRLPEENHEPALEAARRYFSSIRDDPELCIALSETLIAQLVDDPRYPIAETERRRPPRSPDGGASVDAESDSTHTEHPREGLGPPLFGTSRHARPAVPLLSEASRRELSELEEEADAPPAAEPAEDQTPQLEDMPDEPTESTSPTVESWSKPLGHGDAQQPVNPKTNPTGNLRLTQSGYEFDHRTWFRNELFGPAHWTATKDSNDNPIEIATINAEVNIGGVDIGQHQLRVSHGPHREAHQGNVPTVLHWGPELSNVLHKTDYNGHLVTIDRLADGTYRLGIGL